MGDRVDTRAAPPAGPDTEAGGGPSLVDLAGRAGAVGAVVLAGFALIKCYAVANFSLTTGSALLTTAPLSVLLGSLMSYAYWALPLGTLALFWYAWLRHPAGGWGGESTVLVAAGLVTAALSPPAPLLWCTGAFVAYLLLARGLRGVLGGTGSPVVSVRVFFAGAVLVLVFSSLTRPWIPFERIVVQGTGQPEQMVANVLAVDGEWTTIMRAGDRGLSRIRSDDVLTRQLCHLDGVQQAGLAPLMWWLVGRPYSSPNTICQTLVRQHPELPVVAGSLP